MCPDNSTTLLSESEVEAAVRRLWELFASKKVDQWQSLYSDVATVFGTASKRPEPARLVVLRRQREYLSGATKMRINVGRVDVELIGSDCAVAAYLLHLDAEQIAKVSAAGQSEHEEHLENARVSHVFQRLSDGRLLIVHEHISAATD
ncbi:MAG TPA: nuclear transport factor 2 family protein [Candidatus Angelobacter sp.]|nr:nuclear transport factor 2 family protein [Candidatus Angelobacter sp.]